MIDEEEAKDAYYDGRDAAWVDREEINPHPAGTPEHRFFSDGFKKEDKRLRRMGG